MNSEQAIDVSFDNGLRTANNALWLVVVVVVVVVVARLPAAGGVALTPRDSLEVFERLPGS